MEFKGDVQIKILCVGRKGNNRSVALAYLLKLRRHDAIAVGMRCMGRDTRKMMLDWAEKIIVLHNKCMEGVTEEYLHKTIPFHVSCEERVPEFDNDMMEWLTAFVEKEKL